MLYLTKRTGEVIGVNPRGLMYAEADARGPGVKDGSRIFFANGDSVCVRETVEEISTMVREYVHDHPGL